MNTTQQNNITVTKSGTSIGNTLIWVTVFSVAMAMLESSVVIYLRELYYPGGFQFPLRATSTTITITELLRELATLIMLLGIGMLVGKNKSGRFAWFIYSFAIWDLFYYVFLYLIIGWPLSLLDWDVLFLLPIMWTGPVWAPVLLSVLMILLALLIFYFEKRSHNSNLKASDWILLITGAITVIVAFCKDYYLFMVTHFSSVPAIQLFFSEHSIGYSTLYIPVHFDIVLFLFGCVVICLAIGIYAIRNSEKLSFTTGKSIAKRLFDLVFSLIALLVFAIPMTIIVLLLAFKERHSIFFRQDRIGKNKTFFTILKFQTMVDQISTKTGHWLRRTGLDELPQFFNVLKGDMSIVGPRALTKFDIERVCWDDKYHEKRWSLKPGITGFAQIYGGHHRKTSWFWDNYYIKNNNLVIDFAIICASFLMNIFGKKKISNLIFHKSRKPR